MNGELSPWSPAAFEARYLAQSDPWRFASSWYEQRRYQTICSRLLRERYGCAFEPGCSVGELTRLLAPRCASVWATDVAPSVVATARDRCRDLPNVNVTCEQLSPELPYGCFDLIIFSEILYYFAVPEVLCIAEAIASHLEPGGEFVAVHWLGYSRDHQLHGDEVHKLLKRHVRLDWVRGARYPGFRTDTWVRH